MKLPSKLITLAIAMAAIITPARATITLTFQAQEILQGGLGSQPAAAGSLVLLVADTTGAGFNTLDSGPITVGSIIDQAGNDLVVGRFTITAASILTDNQPVLDATQAFTLSNASITTPGDWEVGDQLALYWIPSLTSASNTVGSSVAYGDYTDVVGLHGSQSWITPANGSTANPMLFETTSGGPFGTGTVPASSGYSSLSTPAIAVPEPSAYALLGGLVGLAAVALHRRKVSAEVAA